MTLKLEELGQLVKTVARERRLDAEVLGVTPTEGDGHYAEVLIDLLNPSAAAARVSLGSSAMRPFKIFVHRLRAGSIRFVPVQTVERDT